MSLVKKHLKSFSKSANSCLLISDFVDIQRKSFFELLEKGLIEEIGKRNPISNNHLEIFFYPEFYQLSPPEFNPRRAILLSKSYSSKLFIPIQFTDKKLKKSQLKWVLLGNLPLMTKRGHFILNGAPRVIVNQILRSPGIYFQGSLKEIFNEKWSEKPDISYKQFYTDLICLRGTWLRIEIDKNKDIWAQMKKIPKIPLFWFLLAMGLNERVIFKSVINPIRLLSNNNTLIKRKLEYNYVSNSSEAWKEIMSLLSSKSNTTNSVSSLKKIQKKIFIANLNSKGNSLEETRRSEFFFVPKKKAVDQIVSLKNKESSSQVAATTLIRGFSIPSRSKAYTSFFGQFFFCSGVAKKKQLLNINYRINFQKLEGRNWIFKRFLNPRAYDLGTQGRLNFNKKLNLSIASTQTTLTAQDILTATDYLLKIEKGLKKIDDIDHLKNRRVRTSGELLQIQIGIGLVRLEKAIRENLLKINVHSSSTSLAGTNLLKSKVLRANKFSDDIDIFKSDFFFGEPSFFCPKKKKATKKNIRGTGGAAFFFSSSDFFLEQKKQLLEKKEKKVLQANNLVFLNIKNLKTPQQDNFNRFLLKYSLWGKFQAHILSFIFYFNKNKGTRKNKGLTGISPILFSGDPIFKKKKEEKREPNNRAISQYSINKKDINSFNTLINTKPLNGALREFFGSSQLSQFMDQLNPIAEITHKRRLSSMGPGGVTRDSATLAIRGIHPTHYGRICPIETPEGKNTGLVNSLTTYSRVNLQGFLQTPFFKVYKGQIQKAEGLYYFSADQEENLQVAAGDVSSFLGRIDFLPKVKIPAKIGYGDTISKIPRTSVEYIGVSAIQMISIATSLIPFLEHDDGNRALMGSNMQRQAVPLVRSERPLVGTGLEARAVSDSGHAIIAKKSGYIAYVSGKKIIIME